MIIPFGEWAPDLPDLTPGFVRTAKNVLPQEVGYIPMSGLQSFTDALDARPLGGVTAIQTDGTIEIFAGDASKLYRFALSSGNFSDVSVGGGYSTASDDHWEFIQFGNNVLATNFAEAIQGWTLGSSSAFAAHVTSTRKPKARRIGVVREFVVLGNVTDTTDGDKPQRVWWSAINDSQDFDPDQSTLCDYQDLPDDGWVTKVVSGVEYGLVFQDHAITRMSFVGTPTIFQFDKIDRKRGTPMPGSVIPYGRHVFYISEDGFFYTDGSQSHPIGTNRVDKAFWGQVDYAHLNRVSGAVDHINKCIYWGFPGSGSSSGVPNKIYAYRWDVNRWSEAEIDHELLMTPMFQGYNLDTLDNLTTNIDTLTVSWDSRAYSGGGFQVSAFNTDYKLCTFEGTVLAATIDTAEHQLVPGRRAKVTRVRPILDGSSVTPTIAVGSRDNQHAASSFGSDTSLETSGAAAVRSNARYHRFRVKTSSGDTWTHGVGVDVEEVHTEGNR